MTINETNFPTSYNRELILDLTLQAFTVYNYDHSVEDPDSPKLHAYLPLGKLVKTPVDDPVLDNAGNVVVDGSSNTVTITTYVSSNRIRDGRKGSFKFLTTQGTNYTISEFRDYNFVDFATYDGTGFNFDSYVVTGHNVSQDFMRKKQSIYLLVFCERTETVYTTGNIPVRPSGCLVQSRWEWNQSAAQGKWGAQFQAYRLFLPHPTTTTSGSPFDYGPTVIETKNKLRGSGKSLSLYFQSEAGKDLKLLGWGILGYKVDEP